MKRLVTIIAMFSLLGFLGCGEQLQEESPVDSLEANLTLQEIDNGFEGVYRHGADVVQFQTIKTDVEIRVFVELNGMTLVGNLATNKYVELDGFTTDTGDDTLMRQEDRTLILALIKAVEGRFKELNLKQNDLEQKFLSAINIWAEYPATMKLTKRVVVEKDRSYVSICNLVPGYVQGSHDCNKGDWWDDNTTLDNIYASMHSAGPCNDGTYFWSNGQWRCFEPDHSTTIEYGYGNCFGRCGASCGSGTKFTWDCVDHDLCVRFGHTTASMYCNDEFVATMDDAVSAPHCNI